MEDSSKVLAELAAEYKSIKQISTKKDNGIFYLTLDRPAKYNSLSFDMYVGIGEAINQANADPEVKVIVFSGNGKFFCSGNDLTGFMKMAERFPDFSENQKVLFFQIIDFIYHLRGELKLRNGWHIMF